MRIPPELIDRVRSEVNILDVVSQKVQLHKVCHLYIYN